jgi:hypothetical protein
MSPSAPPSREAELTDPWVALEPGADPAERVRLLRRAHETFTEAGTVQRPVRPVVADSWRRSARAGVGPDGTADVELGEGDLGSYRAEHPLARVMPLFRELMGTFASDGEHLLAVCDEHGRLLWVEGHAGTRRQAEWMNFVPGARWAETAVGTNAPGTAVAVDRPVQVFAAEHFIRRVQPWTCAAAPGRSTIRGPAGCWEPWTSPAATGSRIRTAWVSSRRSHGPPSPSWRCSSRSSRQPMGPS